MPHQEPGRRRRTGFGTVCEVLVLLALPATLASLLPAVPWLVELATHFLPHVAAATLAIGIFLLVSGSVRGGLLSGLVLILAAGIWISTPAADTGHLKGVSAASQNLYFRSRDFRNTTDVLIRESADVLVMQEYTHEWHQSLEPLRDEFATCATEPRAHAFGIAACTNLKVISQTTLQLGSANVPAIVLETEAPAFSGYIIGVHLYSPEGGDGTRERNRQLSDLAAHIGELRKPVVVVGDFNNTWSAPSMRSFLRSTGMQLGTPVQLPTWPTALGPFGIPIDMVAASGDVRIGERSLLPATESDHRGFRFSLAISPETQ